MRNGGDMIKKIILLFFIGLLFLSHIWAQDFGFGFGDEDETFQRSGSSLSVSISGEVSAAVIGYLEDISWGPDNINTRDMFMFSGKLNFLAQSSFAEGVINLKLVPALVPVSIDEAYIRAFFGSLDVTAGLKKLTWGRADQFGPLDIINLPDSSKIFIEMADKSNLMGIKIANPVIHGSFRFGQFSKIEVLFLPSFEIISTAIKTAISPPNPLMSMIIGTSSAERWMPGEMKKLGRLLGSTYEEDEEISIAQFALKETDTSRLNYAQAGIRFTTTIGRADIGIQYFYGRMFQPAVIFYLPAGYTSLPEIEFAFNTYHQVGLDYGQVLFGFNIRSEVAANITEDLSGDNGYIYNPSIGWSFGFDRDLFLGINVNLQANGSVRLFNDKVGSSKDPFTFNYYFDRLVYNPDFDIEAGTSISSTRLTLMLSRKFMRDELELRTAAVWGIEDKDAAIIPALIWTKEDLQLAFSGSFFLGNTDGQLGQYHANKFLKLSVIYMF